MTFIVNNPSGIAQIAFNFNKPVVATGVGGLAEVVLDEKTGFIVPRHDPPALANAIIRFYEEKRESKFVRNIEVEKKKYSWERMVQTIEELVGSQ